MWCKQHRAVWRCTVHIVNSCCKPGTGATVPESPVAVTEAACVASPIQVHAEAAVAEASWKRVLLQRKAAAETGG